MPFTKEEKAAIERDADKHFSKEAGIGHNSAVAADQLRAFVERIEHLAEEKQTIADDIKEVFAEAKGTGFDTKAMRTIIRWRKKDQAERQEEAAILELYAGALGLVGVFG